jgi:hypothetical protein
LAFAAVLRIETRASPKRADGAAFFTALPAKVEEEMDMVVVVIELLRLILCCMFS